jgi:hypothetical protein
MKKLVVLAFALLLLLTACQGKEAGPTDQGTLTLVGLGSEIELTLAELRELDTYSGEANTINSANEESRRSFTGARVDKLLAHFGANLDQYATVTAKAGDGYSVQIPKPILESRQLILAWELEGKPLEGKDAPLRMVVPEERTLFWVRNVVELVFSKEESGTAVAELVFFENLLPELAAEIYTHYGSEDQAVNLAQLVEEEAQATMIAKDGLTKHEYLKAGIDYYIKVDGEDAPLFFAPDLPKGMFVKDLALLIHGNRAILFAASFERAGQVDMAGLMDLLDPYLGETVTLTLAGEEVSGSREELAALSLKITEQGVVRD